MSKNVFFTADSHFGHLGVCQFLRDDGSKLRPFDTAEKMDEILISRWNERVRAEGGDISMRAKGELL